MRVRSSWITAAAIVLAACSPSGPKAADAKPAAAAAEREVRVAVAKVEPWARTIRATGNFAAFEESTLSAKVPGRLAKLAVDVGSRVKQGDVLAQIDPRDYELRTAQSEAMLNAARAQLGSTGDGASDDVVTDETPTVRAAQAELDDAKAERNRVEELARTGVSSKADLDRADARLARADALVQDARQTIDTRRAMVEQRRTELALARQAQTDAAIVAPYDGAVVERLAGTGDYLIAGAPIARLVRFDPLRARIEVPEREALLVQVGQSARVSSEGTAQPIEARVTRMEPGLSERNRTQLVELEIPNPDLALRPGSFARAEIVVDAGAGALCVPIEALATFAGIDKVYAVVDGVAQEKRIEVGRRSEQRVEVLSGLAAGTPVVLAPGGLQAGARVRVVE